jgi:hypothetical protein
MGKSTCKLIFGGELGSGFSLFTKIKGLDYFDS